MSTLRQDIVDTVVRLLNAGRAIDVPEATTRRWIPGDDLTLPAISVWVVEETRLREQRSARFGGPDERTLKLVVQIIDSSADHDLADQQVDRLIQHVDDVMGNTTLENLAHRVIVNRITWEVVQQDRTYCVASCECLIQYQTSRGDSSRAQ